MPLFRNRRIEPKQGNSSGNPEEFRLSLIQHLEELRTRLIRIILLIALGWTLGWFAEPWVYQSVSESVQKKLDIKKLTSTKNAPLTAEDTREVWAWIEPEGEKPFKARVRLEHGGDYQEVFRTATEPFMLKLKLSFVIGLLLTLPFCILQLWGFVEPGLKAEEKRPFRIYGPLSILLFVLGAALCWFILPNAFQWFLSYLSDFPGTSLYQEPGFLIFFVLKMLLAFGVGFQLPILVFFLAKIGILGPEVLTRYWRQATVAIFFGAAAITPSNDIFSMMVMAFALTALFFISMFAVKITSGKALRDAELDDLD